MSWEILLTPPWDWPEERGGLQVLPNPKHLGFYGNLLTRSKQSDLELRRAHGNVLVTEGLVCVKSGEKMKVTVGCACGEVLQP